MRFFDAHCDTVKLLLERRHDFVLGAGEGQVDLPSMVAVDCRVQVLACCVPHRDYAGAERATAEAMLAEAARLPAASDGRLSLVVDRSSLREASVGSRRGLLLALEGADPLDADAANLARFHALGVRSVMPAWSDNEFAGSAFGHATGLTAEGRHLVAAAEELGVMVDVSHLSDRAFWDVSEVARRPFIASHSNCRQVCPSPRNLTDGMIREIARCGGVMGLNLFSAFLDPAFLDAYDRPIRARLTRTPGGSAEAATLLGSLQAAPRPSVEWVARHVRHALAVGGAECIGLGGDLDGSPSLPAGVDGMRDYGRLAEALARTGLSSSLVERVCWGNFARVFGEVLS